MSKNTTWVSKNELKSAFLNVVSKLTSQYDNIEGILTKDLCSLDKNTYHFIAQFLKIGDNRTENALCSYLLNTAYRAEILSQGSGIAAFIFSLAFTKSFLSAGFSNNSNLLDTMSSKMDFIKSLIESQAKVPTKKALVDEISKSCKGDPVLSEVAFQAVSLAGLEGKIFIENGKQDNYLVEHKSGYSFATKPFKFFLNPRNQTWEKSKCKVLIVDGLLEKVSELDHILTKTYENKQPLVIIAQGFSEEVVATLKANQERGNFDSMPVRVMPDLDSLNMINDISIVCGTLPISSLKGDLICFVKYEDLPTVDKVKCTAKELIIENSSTRPSVSAHIKDLLTKRQSQSIEDIQNIFDKRLKSMITNAVIIHLPNVSASINDNIRINLDNVLRAVKSILSYGTVNLENVIPLLPNKDSLDKNIADGLLALGKEIKTLPTLSATIATTLAGKSILLPLTSNGMVELTDPA